MPPLGNRGKHRVKDGQQSRSRNTTPSSVVSGSISNVAQITAYLELAVGSFMVPANLLYEDLLERHGSGSTIPDPTHLEALEADLNALALLAESRERACDKGMRELSNRRKERLEEEQEVEQMSRDAEARANLKRAAEDDELERSIKANKVRKRKDRSSVRDERPLAHGTHGTAYQEGSDTTSKDAAPAPAKVKVASASRPTNVTNTSGSSSSLSPASQLHSPILARVEAEDSAPATPTPTISSVDSHHPLPAASIPLYQTFGADPLRFDDPTIYHVRDVTPDMSDDEKKEIYCVSSFPHDDLHHLIAGVPPDKDFSNAKPSNQVNANTFASYLEPYLRPLTDEDMAFLAERGDRVTPFLMPARGKKHYSEVWAEEDGTMSMDSPPDSRTNLPPNQPRGSIDQIDDQVAETDQVSAGPLLNRLISTMRFENRIPRPDDKEKPSNATNGEIEPGDTTMNGNLIAPSGDSQSEAPLPPATFFSEAISSNWKVPTTKLDYAQVDERLKSELRYLGFISQDEDPDYDGHYDDEVAQRLRFLQSELKRVSIENGARKARLLQHAQERMAHQEYSTILEDLDTQVQQAYLKRNRTLGKGKKTKKPGGTGGGTHFIAGPGTGTAMRVGIGDAAKTVMERRKKWIDTITPVFDTNATRIRTQGDDIFDVRDMAPLLALETERWDEEQE